MSEEFGTGHRDFAACGRKKNASPNGGHCVDESDLPSGPAAADESGQIIYAGAAAGRDSSAALVPLLVGLQRRRRRMIRERVARSHSIGANVRSLLGFGPGLTETERNRLRKRAAQLIATPTTAAWSAAGIDEENRLDTVLMLELLAPLQERETLIVRLMEKTARQLPVEEFRAVVRGFGALGLAIIVGEAGDLSNYATIEKLWKRLGLGLVAGERQQRKTDRDLAALHGYSPARRAEIWTIADSLARHQWRAAKDDSPGHAIGPYGERYAREKAKALAKGWSKGHAEAHARRVMSKLLLENLWKAWGRAMRILPDGPSAGCPPPEESE